VAVLPRWDGVTQRSGEKVASRTLALLLQRAQSMRTNSILLGLACACILAITGAAHADDTFGRPSERSPSMLSYGFKGMGTGALIGLGGGYIYARRHDEGRPEDWRAVGLGTGIGALAGTGVGLGLGAADLGAREKANTCCSVQPSVLSPAPASA
jgi:hypothetical protein